MGEAGALAEPIILIVTLLMGALPASVIELEQKLHTG